LFLTTLRYIAQKRFRSTYVLRQARGLFIFFSSALFSALEHCRNTLAETQKRMVEPRRLSG
jgi:hypothetical protein